MTNLSRRHLLASSIAAAAATSLPGTALAGAPKSAASRPLAPTPPMGWNSWNSFATTITEAQALENARIMVDKLLPSGYDIFTVDIQWYEPNATGYEYRKDAQLTMDEYGRVLPALNDLFTKCQANTHAFKFIY
jgi:hypothetical protein